MESKDIVTNEQLTGALVGRMQALSSLGITYDGARDLYSILGYKKNLLFEDYYGFFSRCGISDVVVSKVAKAVWKSGTQVREDSNNKEQTLFEKEYQALNKRLRLDAKLLRLDILTGIGRYGALFLGFNDSEDFSQPVTISNALQLQYVVPCSESTATIDSYEQSRISPRYGQPLLYTVKTGSSEISGNTSVQSFTVHWSRIIHVVENPLESDIFGTPRLQRVYNYIQDIQKVSGGSAEMFWQGARPGYAAEADKDVRFDLTDTALKEELDEYEHNLRRILRLQGIQMKSLAPQVVSPKDHLDVQLELVSIATGIPKRILLGSERGELASSTDQDTWDELVYQSMINHAEPDILRPFIDRMVSYKVLPMPKNNEYVIEWPELSILGDKDQADINFKKTETLVKYADSPSASMLYPPENFFRDMMKLTDEQIDSLSTALKEFQAYEGEGERLEEGMDNSDDGDSENV